MRELPDDHLADLFAQLRANELRMVRAPGLTAVRRTVRRRRAAATIATAVAVLAIVGATAAGIAGLQSPDADHETAGQGPRTPAARRDAAATALGLSLVEPTRQGRSGQATLQQPYVDTKPILAGTYQLRLACVGAGRITVTARVDTVLTRTVVVCADLAGIRIVPITVPRTGRLVVEARPDADAGQSGFAYQADLSEAGLEHLTDTAAAAAGTGGLLHQSVRSLIAYVDSRTPMMPSVGLDSGAYKFLVFCAGAGTGSLSVSAVDDASTGSAAPPVGLGTVPFTCGAQPQAVSMSFVLSHSARLSMVLTPDDAAIGQAGVMVRVSLG